MRWLVICAMLAAMMGCAPRRSNIASDTAAGFAPGTFIAVDNAIGRRGALVYLRAEGYSDPNQMTPMTEDTMFDVASLTKPMVTSTAAALMICRGDMSADEVIHGYSLDQHLRHSTELPAYMDWKAIERARNGGSPVDAIAQLLRHDQPGPRPYRSVGYSNIGYLLVGHAVEQTAGEEMESLLRNAVWRPLGMNRTTFRPAGDAQVASTANDVELGKPYDQLAAYWLAVWPGHVPGHSGLFTTAEDATRFCQALLYPDRSTVDEMKCISQYLFSERRKELPPGSVAFSSPYGRTPAFEIDASWPGRGAYMQTGYTGTMMWLDPDSGTSLVILTNSVQTDAEAWQRMKNEVLKAVRRGLGG